MGPQLFAYAYSDSSYNLTGLKSPELDKLALAMRTTPDGEKRLELQCELTRVFNEEGTILYWGGGRYWAFTSPRMKGVPDPYRGVVDVTRAWIDEGS